MTGKQTKPPKKQAPLAKSSQRTKKNDRGPSVWMNESELMLALVDEVDACTERQTNTKRK